MIKIFSALFLCLICLLAVFNYQQTSSWNGSKTAHFDGTHFSNVPPTSSHSWFTVMRWLFTGNRSKWPDFVKNTGIPDVRSVTDNHIKVTFVNHATLLVQTAHLTFLTDPIWTERASPLSWLGPKRVRKPGIPFEYLPKIDAVFVSHNHYDHLSLPTLKKLSDTFHPVIFVPLGLKNLLERHGIQNVQELDWWQTSIIKNTIITFLPTQHWSKRGLGDKNKTLWGSWGIVSGNKRVYFGGDTGYSPHFKEINQKWGKPDLAFLPIGAFQPEWLMHDSHMNPQEAVQAHLDLQAGHSIGIHFGTFQLSNESIDQPVVDLNQATNKQKLPSDEFITLHVGESRSY